MKQIFLLIIILLFVALINAEYCIYNNSAINQVYNLTSLKLPYNSGLFYTGQISSKNPIFFNLCNEPTSKCTTTNATACQTAVSGQNLISLSTDPERVDFTADGLNLHFEAEGACFRIPADGKRYTTMFFTCNPNVSIQINTGAETSTCNYTIYIESNLVCKKCPLDCSSQLLRGTCDPHLGTCTCNNNTIFQYDGVGCENSKLYISSVGSTTIEGGETILYGVFGPTNTSNLSIKIGSSECTGITRSINNTAIKCIAPKGAVGRYDVTISDGGFSYVSKKGFSYTPIINTCPNNCSGATNGVCQTNSGICECLAQFNGYDCSAINEPSNPNTTINVLPGQVSFSNEDSNYQIDVYSLVEYTFNGSAIREYIFKNKWNVTNSDLIGGNKIIKYSQSLFEGISGTSIVEYTIEQVNNVKKNYNFAGLNFTINPNSIKFTISIKNYQYLSTLNTIQLRIRSTVGDIDTTTSKKCNVRPLETNDDFQNTQNFNYFTISKDKKIFQSRFINRVVSDGQNAFITTDSIPSTVLNGTYFIGLNMPHCTKECFMDPDFSLLVNSNYQKTCDNHPKWFLPVVIAVPIVGFSIIVIISAIIYKKHRVGIKIFKQKLKLKNLNNNNNNNNGNNNNS